MYGQAPMLGGITDQNILNLGPGSYIITVTDDNGCAFDQSFEITEPGPLSIVINEENNISCFGTNDGSILTTVTGEAPITYVWTAVGIGAITTTAEDDIDSLPPGTYTLTVSDASTTPSVTSPEISIIEPTLLTAQAFTTDASCSGLADGSVLITATDGTPGYMYAIDGGAFQTSNTFTNLQADNYTIQVRDLNQCTFDIQITINQPLPIDINTDLLQSLSAANATDGAISITAFGGTGNLSYSWAGPNSFTATTEDITDLSGGIYILTIKDQNWTNILNPACSFTQDFEIAEPGILTVNIVQSVLLECNGDNFGEIIATIQGGVSPYTYEWFEVVGGNNTALTEDTEIIANLSVGNFFIKITDTNSISVNSNTVTITEPESLQIQLDDTTDVLCSGETTGAIAISVSGGTSPYSYNWSNGETTQDLNNISAGDYNLNLTDSNGCFAEIDVTINAAPDAIQISDVTITNISEYLADDGSISLNITGGATPYTINWVKGSNNTAAGNTATILNLAADVYTVSVSDTNGCSVTETYEITQPDIVEETIIQPTCQGDSNGSISVIVNQGNGAFTYTWHTGQTTNSITSLGAGDYTVTITGFGNGPINSNLYH